MNDDQNQQTSQTNGQQGDDLLADIKAKMPQNGGNIDQLQMDLATANQQIEELTGTAKRALADLQNYKRMMEQDRAQYAQFATVSLLLELLPVLDNFQRAVTHVPAESQETEWFKGIWAIQNQLASLMAKQGVQEIPSPIGQPLDPNLHEAVLTGPGEKDTVVAVLEKGYTLGGKVIRPVKVQVGSGE
ncbi:nucleotide exchange factor GrpE [Candidatus Gracilibacteria bacterium]|nr:nucleotide exchange factor GrpE [Candidatus Gracilibacteria bacterium]